MSVLRRLISASGRLTKEARERAGLPAGERVLAWAPEQRDPSQLVVATDQALYAKGASIPWARIIKAQWDEPFLELLVEQPEAGAQRLRIPLSQPQQLPAAVRTQVTATVVVSEHLTLPDGSQALAAARRAGRDEISWTVVFDDGVDSADPRIRAQADRALAELRDALGI